MSLAEQLKRSWSVTRPAQASAGIVASALGFAVVAAWLTNNEELTRIHRLFPPMPYSVAIGLSVCGVALLAGANGWRRLTAVSAALVLSLGLGTLAQFAFGVDWNLHRTLLGGLIEGSPPGMAPSSALSFVLVGIGLLAVSMRPKQGGFVCAISGTAVAAQNGVAFVWYGFGLASSYVVSGDAPHVAMGLAVAGIGTIAAAWDRNQESQRPPRWLPLPVAFGIALVSLSLWDQSQSDYRATLEEITRGRADRISVDLNHATAPLTSALVRLAEAESASLKGHAPIEPQMLSALDLERFPSVFAIALVDRESGLRWIQTRSSAAGSLADIQAAERACDVLLRRSDRHSRAVVDRGDLHVEGAGFVMGVPFRDEGPVRGFIVALFSYEDFFRATIGEDIEADYGLRVYAGQRELYRHSNGSVPDEKFTATAAISFQGTSWGVQIWPRSVKSGRRPLADTTLVFGLVFAGLIGWTVQLAQHSARSRNQLTNARADLRSAIAARQAAQAAHSEAEVRFKQIIDAAADIIYRTDAKGRFIFVNPAAIRLTKWSRDELIGRSYLSLIRPDYRSVVRAFYEKQTADRTPSTYLDFPVLMADGRDLWVAQHVQLLTDGDQIVGFQAVARDINHRIRIQEELQRMRDAALETARLKSEFVANTSHEIRTPLNGILGFSSLLLDSGLSDEQRTYAEGLRLSADTLLAIVNDILDFSKIEAGMLRLETVSFDLRAAINESIVVFTEAARQKQLTLDTHIDPSLPRRVKGDAGRLRQVLANLLSNAIKFTDHGSITVTVRAETSSETTEDGVVIARFFVRDTGIGIEPEAQHRLFQPFVQADGSVSRQYGGTGLGLAISRQIVELMGGSIGVQSAPGSGSTFSFTVRFECEAQTAPVYVQDGEEDPHRASLAGTAAGPSSEATRRAPPIVLGTFREEGPIADHRILVTDDNPVSRQVTRLLVEKLGYAVETASNGAEAVQATLRERYTLILMDCQMPVMDGYTATAEIRRSEKGSAHTPIIAFTASASSHERERCLRAGMDDFLEKPIRKNELVDLLSRWAGTSGENADDSANEAGTRPAAAEPINLEVLAALERHVGHEDLNQMISLHLEEADASIQRMELATDDDHLADLTYEAHRLKGGSLSLGFVHLGRLCTELEESASRRTELERQQIVQRLKEACGDARRWERRRNPGSSSSVM